MPPHGVHPAQAAKELKAAGVTSPVHKFIVGEAQRRGYTGIPSPPVSAAPKAQPSPRVSAMQRAQTARIKAGRSQQSAGALGNFLGAVGHQAADFAGVGLENLPGVGSAVSAPIISRIAPKEQKRISAQTSLEGMTGYKEIKNIRHNPIAGGLAVAGLIPGFGKGAKFLGEDARVAEAGIKAAGETQAAKGFLAGRRAIKAARRVGSPEEAHAILQSEANKATARALKAARKNPAFVEHLPGEARPDTGGQLGVQIRQAMRDVPKVYKKQKELQKVESLKRTAAMAQAQGKAQNFEEALGAQKHLAGNLPTIPFKGFEPLRPLVDQIKAHIDSLNMLPHDKNRLLHAIDKGLSGQVPAPNERKLIESVFGREVKHLSPEAIKARGVEGTIADILNVPRAMESSFDLSGAFRQNLAAVARNPRLVFKGYHETLHAAVSENKFQELMAKEIHGDPYYHMAKSDGVPITEIGDHLNQREEAYASNLAEHLHEIPGVRSTPGVRTVAKGVSNVVRGSDRNYVLLLNRTRMRLYRTMVDQAAANGWRLDGPRGEKLRKQIADTVGTLTGRGNIGPKLSAHRATFNALFFSPGLMKSRLDLLNPLWYVRAEPFVRQQRLRTALQLYGTLALILFSAKMAGAKVETDPTNANFGKIRDGNTRIDVAGGLTQYMRLVGQLSEGKITSSITGKVEPISNGPFKTSRGNVIQQFARSKFSPVAGLTYDTLFGPGFGQKITPGSVAGNMFVPLLIQDMHQIATAHGPGGGPGMAAATFLPDLFGVGIQNYGPKKKKSSAGNPFGGSVGGGLPDSGSVGGGLPG